MNREACAPDLIDRRIYLEDNLYIRGGIVAGTLTSIRLDTKLADEAVRVLGVKTRTEAVHVALREIIALKGFKKLMKEYSGKLKFENFEK